ncbi:MAG TPA: iron-sulfur cluster assembly protein [Alphaproteobacteria bacterium]
MMKQVASKEMVEQALGDDYDPMSEPPETTHSDHKLWLRIRAALCEVYDPEIPVNIYELGLMYNIEITDASDQPGVSDVAVKMTLTSPNCPVAQDMPGMVQGAIMPIDGIGEVTVDIVFEPTWAPYMMAETAKLQLNMF